MMIQLIALMAAVFSLNAFSQTTSLVEDLKNQNRELQKIIDKNNQIIRKKIGSTSQTIRKKKVRRTVAPKNGEQLLMGDLNDFFRKMPNRTVPQNFMIGTGISTIEGMTATSNNYGSYSEMFYIAPALIVGWQVLDNVWIEGSYARRVASDVPEPGMDVIYQSVVARFKYDYRTRWYGIHLQPYAGYQSIQADAPGIGENTSTFWVDPDQLKREKEYLDSLNQNKFIIGLSLFKPFMNSFFVRGDLGTDWRSASLGYLF